MMMHVNYDRLPEHMRDTARLYVEHGYQGGSFFTAVVSNDFKGAFGRADDANIAAMRDWAMWLYNDAPCGCQGSPEHVREWIKSGGLVGIEAERRARQMNAELPADEREVLQAKGMIE